MLLDRKPLFGFERDALHRETARHYGPQQQTRQYDVMGRLTCRQHLLGEEAKQQRLYHYAPNPVQRVDALGLSCNNLNSRIKESDRLAKEAQITGTSYQTSIDRLTEQLASGNTNPSIGYIRGTG